MDNKLTTIKLELEEELKKTSIDFNRISTLSDELLMLDDQSMRFSVDARHVRRLGFELVGKQETAIGELIKNTYDADATYVHINFENYSAEGGNLVVADNGHGMSEDVVRRIWMKLSSGDKEDNPISPMYGRSRAGRKGIGRFAVERLGKELLLETKIAGSSEGIRVFFEWDANYVHGSSLTQIANKFEYFSKPKKEHGTRLEIRDLRDRWTDKALERIWRSVLLLQPPFKQAKRYRLTDEDTTQFEADPGFKVHINGVSEKELKQNISLDSAFLSHRIALIKGFIDSDGRAHYSVKSKGLDFKDQIEAEDKYALIGVASFEANYFIYTPDAMSGFSVRQAQNMGNEYGGIRVYRDGFRVLPYGENRDDWLKLSNDTARRSLLVPANNQNFFGELELSSKENVLLEETSSREGLIENEAFEELRDFVRSGIEWAALRVASRRKRKQTASEKDFTSKVRKPSKIIDDVIIEAKKRVDDGLEEESVELLDHLDSLKQSAKDYELYTETKFQQQYKEHIEYESMLRILASLGISIAVFSHETSGAVTRLSSVFGDLKDLILLHDSIKNNIFEELFGDIDKSMLRLDNLSSYILDQVSHTGSREKHPVPLSGVIEKFIAQFKDYLDTRNISFDYKVEPPYLRTIPMHRSEIDSVLFNFLTNSIKSMDRDNIKNREIFITAALEGKKAVIRFQDSGKGVPDSIRNLIFDAFFTTSTQNRDEIAGPGTGLGLKIVSDIAEANGGFVRISTPDKGYGGCFEFGVPVSENQL